MSLELKVKKYNENGEELAIRFALGAIKAVGVGAMSALVDVREKDGDFKDIYNFSSRSGAKILNKKSVEALSKAGAFDGIHKNRHQILESCEMICKYGASKEEEQNSNQMSLFGKQSKVQIKDPSLVDVKDWSKEERLQKEFEAFGFFVNEHPIDDYLVDLRKRGVISSNVLGDEIIKDNSIIKLAGVVAYSRHRSGSKGRFAYLTLSDPIGIYETLIFDEDLITNARDLMEAGQSLVMTCLVRKDDGGTRLLVREIIGLNEFIKNTKAKSEEYQDIKLQPRRDRNSWQNKNDSNDPREDIIALEIEHKKRIDELRKKDFLDQISININERDAIFNVKSFLSQKLAPKEIEKSTKIFIITGNNKIELSGGYLIDKKDSAKLNSISGVSCCVY